VRTGLFRQSIEDKSKYLSNRLDHWIELAIFPPNVNVTDVMEKIAGVGGSERNLFSLCLIEEGTARLMTGRTQIKYNISISSSVDCCIHPRA
jgi:hypothetical protein